MCSRLIQEAFYAGTIFSVLFVISTSVFLNLQSLQIAGLFAFAISSFNYVFICWAFWRKDFCCQNRFRRDEYECPSNKSMPLPKGEHIAVQRFRCPKLVTRAVNCHNFKITQAMESKISRSTTSSLMRCCPHVSTDSYENQTPCVHSGSVKSLMLQSKTIESQLLSGKLQCLSEDKDCLNLQEDHAENLDMDHIWVSFWDYLWTMVFVSTSSNCKWIFGILILRLREKLHDKQKRNRYLGKFVQSCESESKSDFCSWIRIFGCWISSLLHKILEVTIASPAMLDGDSKEVKYAERVADFILNSHLVIHFTHMQEEVS